MGRDHRKLRAFEAADTLAQVVYKETADYPEEGIKDILRHAAIRVPTNIVDGCARSTMREYINCLTVAFGALREVGYLVELSEKLEYIDEDRFDVMNDAYDESAKLLAGLIRSLKERKSE
ncbi:hypothetical protein KS4_30160 [Poriferisphaera corsica]|uniref:Four helix bundle protein n=1 Tax=Poriferisphaera corsica TaxID=2528020 RepID=A0A517YXK1_9BACT|nr:four helix bundle protein [Poriferisphaera corsica]QDU34939.1 hypothetical protein KS4_30160 [Poriferisphaera corsica]